MSRHVSKTSRETPAANIQRAVALDMDVTVGVAGGSAHRRRETKVPVPISWHQPPADVELAFQLLAPWGPYSRLVLVRLELTAHFLLVYPSHAHLTLWSHPEVFRSLNQRHEKMLVPRKLSRTDFHPASLQAECARRFRFHQG